MQLYFVDTPGVYDAERIVSPSADLSEFDDANAASQLILVTCHPKYSVEERLIIVAKLLDGGTQ